jgi:spermidine/putrescine transport system permease protein
MMKSKLSVILRWVVLIVVLVAIYLPLALIVIYSFSSARDIGGEGEFTTSLYTALFEDESLMSAVVNTLIIGLCSATLATAIGTFSSVGIHYMKKAKKHYSIWAFTT